MNSSNFPQPLNGSLFSSDSFSDGMKHAILDLLWPVSGLHDHQHSLADFDTYFAFFRQECRYARPEAHAIESFGDLMFILQMIRGNLSLTLSNLLACITNANTAMGADEGKLSVSLELVIRLWLMANVRILMPMDRHQIENSLPWSNNQTLIDVFRRHVHQSEATQFAATGSFPVHLNVFDMKRIAGFQVVWTSHLMDHLNVRDKSVYLYHHVSVVKRMRESIPE